MSGVENLLATTMRYLLSDEEDSDGDVESAFEARFRPLGCPRVHPPPAPAADADAVAVPVAVPPLEEGDVRSEDGVDGSPPPVSSSSPDEAEARSTSESREAEGDGDGGGTGDEEVYEGPVVGDAPASQAEGDVEEDAPPPPGIKAEGVAMQASQGDVDGAGGEPGEDQGQRAWMDEGAKWDVDVTALVVSERRGLPSCPPQTLEGWAPDEEPGSEAKGAEEEGAMMPAEAEVPAEVVALQRHAEAQLTHLGGVRKRARALTGAVVAMLSAPDAWDRFDAGKRQCRELLARGRRCAAAIASDLALDAKRHRAFGARLLGQDLPARHEDPTPPHA